MSQYHKVRDPGAAAIPIVAQQAKTGVFADVREVRRPHQLRSREGSSPFDQSDMRLDLSDQHLSNSAGKRGGSQASAYKKLRSQNRFKTVEDQINKFRKQNDACKLKIMKLEKRLHSGIELERMPGGLEAARSPNDSPSLKTYSRKSQSKSKSTAAQTHVWKKSALARPKKGVKESKLLRKSNQLSKNF